MADGNEKIFQGIAERLGELQKAVNHILQSPLFRGKKFKELDERISNLETTIDCMLGDRKYVAADDVGFNEQMFRKQIFLDLIKAFDFEVIVETGTWTGNTTAYMAQNSGLPTYSVELNPRFHVIASMRLEEINDVHLYQGESSDFLDKLSQGEVAQKNSFIYLDAHWYEDLPLERELEIIASRWNNFVIMVDDFEVPSDEGYRYDRYPNGQALDYASYKDIFARHNLIAFSPVLSAAEETGAKSGCIVLAKEGETANQLDQVSSLRRC